MTGRTWDGARDVLGVGDDSLHQLLLFRNPVLGNIEIFSYVLTKGSDE